MLPRSPAPPGNALSCRLCRPDARARKWDRHRPSMPRSQSHFSLGASRPVGDGEEPCNQIPSWGRRAALGCSPATGPGGGSLGIHFDVDRSGSGIDVTGGWGLGHRFRGFLGTGIAGSGPACRRSRPEVRFPGGFVLSGHSFHGVRRSSPLVGENIGDEGGLVRGHCNPNVAEIPANGGRQPIGAVDVRACGKPAGSRPAVRRVV